MSQLALREQAPVLSFGGMDRRERLARAIHEAYVRQKLASGARREDMQSWEVLSESQRDSSLQHADDVEPKLARIGCRLTDAPAPNALDAFDRAEVELLARVEHERWGAERRAAGWELGDTVDEERRRTPWLIDWDQLPEVQREMDRVLVRAIPAAAAAAGLAVIRDA